MKYIYVVVGFVCSIPVTSAFALTLTESKVIADYQEAAFSITGSFEPVYDDKLSVFTYEKLCKGYYTVEDNGVTVTYTGFGDLADNYTYEESSQKVDSVATTTDIIDPKLDIGGGDI